MVTTRLLVRVMRLSGVGALLLGIAVWVGYRPVLTIHILLGATLVFGMWGIALVALGRGVKRGFGLLVFLWGLGIPVLGAMQARLLPGSRHWIIAVAHLLVGSVGAALGMALGRTLDRATGQNTQDFAGPSRRAAA